MYHLGFYHLGERVVICLPSLEFVPFILPHVFVCDDLAKVPYAKVKIGKIPKTQNLPHYWTLELLDGNWRLRPSQPPLGQLPTSPKTQDQSLLLQSCFWNCWWPMQVQHKSMLLPLVLEHYFLLFYPTLWRTVEIVATQNVHISVILGNKMACNVYFNIRRKKYTISICSVRQWKEIRTTHSGPSSAHAKHNQTNNDEKGHDTSTNHTRYKPHICGCCGAWWIRRGCRRERC